MTNIPATLEDVTKQWLTTTLSEEGHQIPQLNGLSLTPIGEGVGMMSAISILNLDWQDANSEMPDSLVIKINADNETNRSVAQLYNLYEKEVSYYRDLSPRTESRSPKIYASGLDDEQNFYLLMEDVSDYRVGSQVTGATFDETKTCLTEAAKLHAAFWGKLEELDWLPHMSNSDNARNLVLGAESGWPQVLEYFGEFVPASINARKQDYLDNISRLQEALDQPPYTLIQGDFRMDNMLFGQKPEHAPLMVVDYQGPLMGTGMADIAYLMSQSTQTEVRRTHERTLIQHYVNVLRENGVVDYDFEQAWEQYRIAVLYSWTVAIVIAGTMDPDNDRGYAWMAKMVKRNGTAIEDLNCLDLF